MSDSPKLEAVNIETKDMRLPPGSAVIQCILTAGAFSVRTVLVGFNDQDIPEFDPLNVAHRFANAVFSRMDELMAEVNGGGAVYTPSNAEIEMQIGGDDAALQKAIAQVEANGIHEFGKLPPSGVVAAPEAKPADDPEFDGRADLTDKLKQEVTGEFHMRVDPAKFESMKLVQSEGTPAQKFERDREISEQRRTLHPSHPDHPDRKNATSEERGIDAIRGKHHDD